MYKKIFLNKRHFKTIIKIIVKRVKNELKQTQFRDLIVFDKYLNKLTENEWMDYISAIIGVPFFHHQELLAIRNKINIKLKKIRNNLEKPKEVLCKN